MGFDGSHPVASAAARLCRSRHGHSPSWEDVACPECWEATLLADKEAAAEAGLPEECPADPYLIDEVAVNRAVSGEAIELTVAEWQAAKRALMQRRQVCLRRARFLLARNVTVVDALGSPLEPGLLGQVSAGRVVSPARVVTLATRIRARRQVARREVFTAGLASKAA
ncbi:hypothetical protein L0U85_04840 [Glycomyces sp. L485]|uniref:hypothetical protein n=1 Tax=Glycomyces sp. L485 TaxID=2909235 RepID=UPI001F4B9841|nr:hypothetical protein [Glycomyces sp. L485]MCH7230192.1 hypothetical protein [Glycomyces sp. L485]